MQQMDRLDWLKTFTREAVADAPESRRIAEDIISNLVGREVVWEAEVDIDTFVAPFCEHAEDVRAVLETVQSLKRPAAPSAQRSAKPTAPPWPSQEATTRPPPKPTPMSAADREWVAAGPELLCTRSGRVPRHAVLGNDERLYDRDVIAGTHAARNATPDHTMTGAINSWREHRANPALCLEELRTAVQCPITMEVPQQPVIAADGFTYEGISIATHLQSSGTKACSPVTNAPLAHHRLMPNKNLERLITALGLAEPDAPTITEYCYISHPRMGTVAVLPEGPHRHVFDALRSCLAALYALAPLTPTNASQTEKLAQGAHDLLANILKSTSHGAVRRVAHKLSAELHCLTEHWQDALKDLDSAGQPVDLFDYTRRVMVLQATGKHKKALAYMRQAALQGLFTIMSDTCEASAIQGDLLRHKHRYALAEQVLQRSLEVGPSTVAERALAKTRRSMAWRWWIRSCPMTDAQIRAAMPPL